ncbi:MAG: hypothetical protein EHM85_13390 [Desulfobacteraceae bacterium]|nr:MAG: hypothetical protein EHM85_13390 [Desulfobacteraceae bacterium]
MENKKNDCPFCGEQMDDNHFASTSFPGIDEPICCNCNENLRLMFTYFEKYPSDNGYVFPDNSDRLEQVTGRTYLENRLLFYLYYIKKRKLEGKPVDAEEIGNLEAEIEKISLAIKEGHR